MIPVDDPTSLSRLFHANSEPWLDERAYRGSPYHQEFTSYPDAEREPLPVPPDGIVATLAAGRQSTRAFADTPLSRDALATLLQASYGIVGAAGLPGGGGHFLRRRVPSAGGLYPLELYPMLRRVDKLPDGIYHFDARGDALERLRAGDWSAGASDAFYTWPFIERANAIVCLSASFARMQSKYGPRGYRYILLEAGHVAQNLCLAAGEIGLGTLCMGGFRDARLNALLGLEPEEQGVVYAVAVGNPAEPAEAGTTG